MFFFTFRQRLTFCSKKNSALRADFPSKNNLKNSVLRAAKIVPKKSRLPAVETVNFERAQREHFWEFDSVEPFYRGNHAKSELLKSADFFFIFKLEFFETPARFQNLSLKMVMLTPRYSDNPDCSAGRGFLCASSPSE